jgi:hypothetical protein
MQMFHTIMSPNVFKQAWRLDDPVKWAPQYLQNNDKWALQYQPGDKWIVPEYLEDDKASFFPRYGSSLGSASSGSSGGLRSMRTVIKKLGGGMFPGGGASADLYPGAAGEGGPSFWRPPSRVRYL